jgi:hypothetical protein
VQDALAIDVAATAIVNILDCNSIARTMRMTGGSTFEAEGSLQKLLAN